MVGGSAGPPAGASAEVSALTSAGEMVGGGVAEVAAAAAAAVVGATGVGRVSAGSGTAAAPAARYGAVSGAGACVASSAGSCGCAAATADAEKRILKKLCDIVKKTAEDRKSDDKLNKVMRQEVTAIADEVKSIKKRTGKLVAGLDEAKGDVKRTSEGLEALNKTLTLTGTASGAAGAGSSGAAQAANTVGNTQMDFFSGEPKKAPWVKAMVVRSWLSCGCPLLFAVLSF